SNGEADVQAAPGNFGWPGKPGCTQNPGTFTGRTSQSSSRHGIARQGARTHLDIPPQTGLSSGMGGDGNHPLCRKRARQNHKGDPGGVRPVVENSIALVRRYAKLIGTGDFNGAYELTDSGLQAWMNLKKFEGEHERAAREYGGSALEFLLDQFAYVYADETVR